MTDIKQTTERWCELAEFLNKKIIDSGEPLTINQHDIWNGYLHEYTNKDWQDFIHVLLVVYDKYPQYFKSFNEDAMVEARMKLDDRSLHDLMHELNYKGYSKKPIKSVLDIPAQYRKTGKPKWESTKGTGWKMMHALHDVYNAIAGVNVKIDAMLKDNKKEKKLTVFTHPAFTHDGK